MNVRRPLRYLLFATHVPASGSGGGIVRYTVALAEALARTDIELHVLVTEQGAQFFRSLVPPERVHLAPRGPTPVRSIWERAGMLPALRRQRFDVVHGAKHIVPWRGRGALRVLTVHDTLLMDRPADYAFLKRLLLRRPYVRSVLDSDVLVTVSHATRDRLVDYFPQVAGRTTAVPLASSNRLVAVAARPVDALAGRRFALIVGDALARKNIGLAVRTWPKVRAAHGDAVLVVVGPPTAGQAHFGAAWHGHVAEGAVLALGHVSDAELRWLYEHAGVVLFPSLLEGFGLPAAEAAAFGAPVVTSDDPALCEATDGWGRAVAAWSDEEWARAVIDVLDAEPADPRRTPERRVRSWSEVPDEPVAAVRAQRTRAAAPRPAAGVHEGPGRIGISPYAAPARVLHVVDYDDGPTRQAVEHVAETHRQQGWMVVVTGDAGAARSYDQFDVVALHGHRAGRLRRKLRGSVSTVVFAGQGPRGFARLSERRLARWTNALVLAADATSTGKRIAAPLTRLTGPGLNPDEVAAILVRARAWGQGITR